MDNPKDNNPGPLGQATPSWSDEPLAHASHKKELTSDELTALTLDLTKVFVADAKLWGLKRLSNNYGGLPHIDKTFSYLNSAVFYIVAEHYRNPTESEIEHVYRAIARIAVDKALGALIDPILKKLTPGLKFKHIRVGSSLYDRFIYDSLKQQIEKNHLLRASLLLTFNPIIYDPDVLATPSRVRTYLVNKAGDWMVNLHREAIKDILKELAKRSPTAADSDCRPSQVDEFLATLESKINSQQFFAQFNQFIEATRPSILDRLTSQDVIEGERAAKRYIASLFTPKIDLNKLQYPIPLGDNVSFQPEINLLSNRALISLIYAYNSPTPITLGIKVGALLFLELAKRYKPIQSFYDKITDQYLALTEPSAAKLKKWYIESLPIYKNHYDHFKKNLNRLTAIIEEKTAASDEDLIKVWQSLKSTSQAFSAKYKGDPADLAKLQSLQDTYDSVGKNLETARQSKASDRMIKALKKERSQAKKALNQFKTTRACDEAKLKSGYFRGMKYPVITFLDDCHKFMSSTLESLLELDATAQKTITKSNASTDEISDALPKVLGYAYFNIIIDGNHSSEATQILIKSIAQIAKANNISDSMVKSFLEDALMYLEHCQLDSETINKIDQHLNTIAQQSLDQGDCCLTDPLFHACHKFYKHYNHKCSTTINTLANAIRKTLSEKPQEDQVQKPIQPKTNQPDLDTEKPTTSPKLTSQHQTHSSVKPKINHSNLEAENTLTSPKKSVRKRVFKNAEELKEQLDKLRYADSNATDTDSFIQDIDLDKLAKTPIDLLKVKQCVADYLSEKKIPEETLYKFVDHYNAHAKALLKNFKDRLAKNDFPSTQEINAYNRLLTEVNIGSDEIGQLHKIISALPPEKLTPELKACKATLDQYVSGAFMDVCEMLQKLILLSVRKDLISLNTYRFLDIFVEFSSRWFQQGSSKEKAGNKTFLYIMGGLLIFRNGFDLVCDYFGVSQEDDTSASYYANKIKQITESLIFTGNIIGLASSAFEYKDQIKFCSDIAALYLFSSTETTKQIINHSESPNSPFAKISVASIPYFLELFRYSSIYLINNKIKALKEESKETGYLPEELSTYMALEYQINIDLILNINSYVFICLSFSSFAEGLSTLAALTSSKILINISSGITTAASKLTATLTALGKAVLGVLTNPYVAVAAVGLYAYYTVTSYYNNLAYYDNFLLLKNAEIALSKGDISKAHDYINQYDIDNTCPALDFYYHMLQSNLGLLKNNRPLLVIAYQDLLGIIIEYKKNYFSAYKSGHPCYVDADKLLSLTHNYFNLFLSEPCGLTKSCYQQRNHFEKIRQQLTGVSANTNTTILYDCSRTRASYHLQREASIVPKDCNALILDMQRIQYSEWQLAADVTLRIIGWTLKNSSPKKCLVYGISREMIMHTLLLKQYSISTPHPFNNVVHTSLFIDPLFLLRNINLFLETKADLPHKRFLSKRNSLRLQGIIGAIILFHYMSQIPLFAFKFFVQTGQLQDLLSLINISYFSLVQALNLQPAALAFFENSPKAQKALKQFSGSVNYQLCDDRFINALTLIAPVSQFLIMHSTALYPIRIFAEDMVPPYFRIALLPCIMTLLATTGLRITNNTGSRIFPVAQWASLLLLVTIMFLGPSTEEDYIKLESLLNYMVGALLTYAMSSSLYQLFSNGHQQVILNDFFNVKDMPKDGHCFYHAVSLYVDADVNTLRQNTADYMKQQKANLKQNYDPEVYQMSLDDYIKKVATTNQWADHLEIFALSHYLKRPIVVLGEDGLIHNLDIATSIQGEPIFVLYNICNGKNHYDGLTLLNSCKQSPQSVLKEFIQFTQTTRAREKRFREQAQQASGGFSTSQPQPSSSKPFKSEGVSSHFNGQSFFTRSRVNECFTKPFTARQGR